MAQHSATVSRLFRSFFRIGLTAFGGPAMIAHIGETAVKRGKWLDQETFKRGVALSQSLPGATAMQVAAYVGLKAGGLAGALAAFTGFGLPAFLLMAALSSLYAGSRELPWVVSIFGGLQVIVVAIVGHAVFLFGRPLLRNGRDIFLATASAAAFFLSVSPFLVIISAALAGVGIARSGAAIPAAPPSKIRLIVIGRLVAPLLAAIGAGMGILYLVKPDLFGMALLMMKVDLFAFGGGFASLPLMLDEIVHVRGWMDSRTFMDGIALGQITPGPIVITATFVGYLVYGFVGAAVATVAIFTPSFVLLVIAAPLLDILVRSHRFKNAVAGILASFLGLLLFVVVTFAVAVPWDVARILLAAASLLALLGGIDILFIVLAGAAAALLIF